jgi:hypothetical protein
MQTSTLTSLQARVAEHPWRTLGDAFLLGAWVALDPPHVPRNRIARAVFAMIGSMTIHVLRDVMLRELIRRVVSVGAASSAIESSAVETNVKSAAAGDAT